MSGFEVQPSDLRSAADKIRAAVDGVKADMAKAAAGGDVGHAGLAAAFSALCSRSDQATTAGVVSLDLAGTALDSTASSYAAGDAQTAHEFEGKERSSGVKTSHAYGSAKAE